MIPSCSKRYNGKRQEKNSESNKQGEEPVKKEIPPPYSFPDDQEGKTLQGTVVLLIQNRRMRLNFGFISLCTGEDYKDPKYPRIYYNPSCIKEKVYLRKGYQVQFIAKNDEQCRSCAQDIELTESGRQTIEAMQEHRAARRLKTQGIVYNTSISIGMALVDMECNIRNIEKLFPFKQDYHDEMLVTNCITNG
jgi:hypothetical protein